jgi:predicted Zn-dependent protease
VSALESGAEIVERALAAATADHTTIIARSSGAANLRFAGNTLTTNGASRDRSITVISVIDGSVGVRTASAVSDVDALGSLVRQSEAEAREAPAAEDFSEPVAATQDHDFELPATYRGVEVFETFARALGDAFDDARRDAISLYGFASHDTTTTWLGNSSGTRRRHVQPTGSVEWTAKSAELDASVWRGQATHDFTDVDVVETVADLRTRLSWSARKVELTPGRYETLLPPAAMADLLIYTYWSAAGREADEGRTVFSRPGGGTRMGEMLAPPGVSLWSDPRETGLEVTPFVATSSSSSLGSVFDNGMSLDRTTWIDDGALAALIQTRASAVEAGTAATGFVGNLVLDGGGGASLADMIRRTRRGILLTCLWYIRTVEPETLLLTGLTRDGVYVIEDGEIIGAANNFRFNESPVDLLGRLSEVGAAENTYSREWGENFPWTKMPPVRIPDFNFSSSSPAS